MQKKHTHTHQLAECGRNSENNCHFNKIQHLPLLLYTAHFHAFIDVVCDGKTIIFTSTQLAIIFPENIIYFENVVWMQFICHFSFHANFVQSAYFNFSRIMLTCIHTPNWELLSWNENGEYSIGKHKLRHSLFPTFFFYFFAFPYFL